MLILFLPALALAAVQARPVDDGFDPGLFFIFVAFCAACLVLVGIGIVVALLGLACAALLVAFGIVSTSAMIALTRRRLSAGFRALHYQLFAAATAPCGVLVLWLGSVLFHFHLRHRYILVFGLLAGIAAGIGMAFLFDRTARFVYRRFMPSTEIASTIAPNA